MEKSRFLPRILIITVMILMIVAMPTGQALAALTHCRTDPIFSLSNGDKLTITLDISTDALNIRNVTYVLHVPAGVTVKSVVYTAGGIGTKELYKVYQDSAAKTYKTETLVTVQNTGSTAMTSTVKLNSLTAKSASGFTGQYIVVTVTKP